MGKISQSIVIVIVGLLSWQDIVAWTDSSSKIESRNPLFGVIGFLLTSPVSSHQHYSNRQEGGVRTSMVKGWLGDIMGGTNNGDGGGGNCVAKKEKELKSSFQELVSQDWSSIRCQWEEHSDLSQELRQLRSHSLKDGKGPASPLHTLRIFDNDGDDNDDVRVTLYRDSASWCPYCQKVWTALEEKRINYRVEFVNMRCYGDKTPQFLSVQPNGNIPVAIIDGVTYRQSNDILQVLDQTFTGPHHPPLSPKRNSDLEDRANSLFRLERQLFGAWMYWITSRDDASARLKNSFVNVLQQVEQELKYANSNLDGSFFLGKDVSMVDFMFIPFVERMLASLLYFKGFPIRIKGGSNADNKLYPNVNKWMDAMETLPSYQLTKSDYYTHCWDLPPQLGSCITEDDTYQSAINGIDGISWDLPLKPHNGGIEPDWEWCNNNNMNANLEAVERLTFNHKNIIKFAARGADTNNNPFTRYSAPLADPKAPSNPNVMDSIDVILKVISMQLMKKTSTENDNENTIIMTKLANALVQNGGPEHVQGVTSSLAYLRDRIGVPRDMKLPAAQLLRAHLNWSIKHLQQNTTP